MVRFASFLAFLTIAVVLVVELGGRIEGRINPVVTDVEITRIDRLGQQESAIWGTFNLRRSETCDFAGVEWYLRGVQRDVLLIPEFRDRTIEREDGFNEFGPWVLRLSPEQINRQSYAYAVHRCHILFRTISKFW